ncbi:MAG: hypothetical protein F7C33_02095 [Desulfurococcales archaeon]|nr:hypothetical protein [Desulfurococcales archaeon]
MGEDREEKVVVEYSDDKELSAEILAKALMKDGVPVEMVKRRGRGILVFKLNDVLYREDEYPYLVARVSRKRRV